MSAIQIRRSWARRMMARATGPVPPYGSPQWCELPEGDAAKVAAVVRAAEVRAREGDDLESDLRAEVEAARLAHKQAEDAEYLARIADHREQWKHLASAPTPFAGQSIPPRDLHEVGRDAVANLGVESC